MTDIVASEALAEALGTGVSTVNATTLRAETLARATARAQVNTVRAEVLDKPTPRVQVSAAALESLDQPLPDLEARSAVFEVATWPVPPVEIYEALIEVCWRETAAAGIQALAWDAFGDVPGPEIQTGVFAFRHDWSEALIERLEWRTQVDVTASGNEFRAPLRQVPRRELRYQVGAGRAYDGLVADWLADHLGRLARWPLPQHGLHLTETADAGALALAVSADAARLAGFSGLDAAPFVDAGGLDGWPQDDRWAWLDSPAGWQVVRLQSVSDDQILLADPLVRPAPAGTWVVPLVFGVATQDSQFTQHLPGRMSGEVAARVAPPAPPWANPAVPEASPDALLDGLPVWPDGNWAQAQGLTTSATLRQMDLVDADPWVVRADPTRRHTLERRYLFPRSERDTWLRRLWLAQGRANGFWLPDHAAPVLTLRAEAALEATHLAVASAQGLPAFWHREAGALVIHPDGQVMHLLTGILNTDADGEVLLALDAPLSAVVPAGSRLIRLLCCRLNHDAIELAWHHDGLLELAITALTLPEQRGTLDLLYYF